MTGRGLSGNMMPVRTQRRANSLTSSLHPRSQKSHLLVPTLRDKLSMLLDIPMLEHVKSRQSATDFLPSHPSNSRLTFHPRFSDAMSLIRKSGRYISHYLAIPRQNNVVLDFDDSPAELD